MYELAIKLAKKQGAKKMRKELYKSKYLAKKNATWACKIIKVEGGYMAFEAITDYWQFCQEK
jgi:hypothetical protein